MHPVRSLQLIIAITIAGTLLLLGGHAGAQSEPPVEISIAPEISQVVAGETAEIAVEIAEAREIYGFDVRLSFDPAVIEIVDADPGQDDVQVAMGTFLNPDFVIRNVVDNQAGTLWVAMTQMNPSEAKSGAGVLIVITVQGKTTGATSPLTITKGEVAQRTGIKLPTTLISGEMQVVSTPNASPTATPIPTQAAGTPLPTRTPIGATATPVDAPTATATTIIAASPTPASTPTEIPTPTATQPPPTEPPPTFTPTEPPPAPTATPLATPAPPSATPEPEQTDSAAVSQTTTPTAAVAATVAAAAPDAPTSGVTPVKPVEDISSGQAQTNQEEGANRRFLFLGAGLLLAALALVVGAIVVWRRSTPQ